MKCARRIIVLACLMLIVVLLKTFINRKEQHQSRPSKDLNEELVENDKNVNNNKVTVKKTFNEIRKKLIQCKNIKHSKNDIDVKNIWLNVAEEIDQGITLKESSQKYKLGSRELHVIVIPHSHSDPGWLKTFDDYVFDQTYQTLENIANELEKLPNMTFVWAESSFLNAWAERTQPKNLAKIRKHLESGRLEIVEGGWVVPDQATPSLYGLINQMKEGHSWLQKYLKYTPRNGWALDPFGYSDTHPYLYKIAGYEHMVILRVHSGVKHSLEDRKALHFDWRQPWDSSGKFDMPTHMMPYTLYNIKHTCGPSTETCLLFDFRQIPGEISESLAEPVQENNVKLLASKLVDQWSQKAVLAAAGTNPAVILVPLGDDFRYDRRIEWSQQYENYITLFNYINSQKDWKVKARFGTVADYVGLKKKFMPMPGKKLSGDFFPYADKPLNYWTGYFTTRPALKRLGKVLEYNLRATEILYALTNINSTKANSLMTKGRRAFGLFMHHDAITGTSKLHVVKDYVFRMQDGLKALKTVAELSIQTLLHNKERLFLLPDPSIKVSWGKNPLPIFHSLAVFNSVEHKRKIILEIGLKQKDFNLIGDDVVKCQVNPKWRMKEKAISKDEYVLICMVTLKPLSVSTFSLINDNQATLATVETSLLTENFKGLFKVTSLSDDSNVKLEGEALTAEFSTKTGLVENLNGRSVHAQILAYASSGSGAYLFGAEGPASGHGLSSKPTVHVIRGPVISEVIHSQDIIMISSRVIHLQSDMGKALHLFNRIDLTDKRDLEIIARFQTDLKLGNGKDSLFTDLNGFNTVSRTNISHLPLQANFFPATEFVFLQGKKERFTVLLGQSHAVSSLKQGQIDVLLDRSPSEDDGKGLGGGIEIRTSSKTYLALLFEKSEITKNATLVQPTLLSRHISFSLNNPPLVFTYAGNIRLTFSFLLKDLPCDVRILALRKEKLNQDACLLILHKLPFSCKSNSLPSNCFMGKVKIYDIFRGVRKVTSTSLTMINDHKVVPPESSDLRDLNPMEIYAYKIFMK